MKNRFFIKYQYLIIFGIAALALDRVTKLIAISGGEFSVNPGIAFGLAGNIPGILFFLIALGIIALIYFGNNLDLTQKTNQVALGLILGGGISNILDRIFYGGVVDFIHLFSISTFNLADLFIVGGAAFLIGSLWNYPSRSKD